jgi:tRNA(fMet)-specific endonuclease VapC
VIFLDTNVAIDIRDGIVGVEARVAAHGDDPVLSFVTRIELEGGIYRVPALATPRRSSLNRMLRLFRVVPLTDDDVAVYGQIVARCGFDRRRVLDRLIAAQALSRHVGLVTANGTDFADIPDLKLFAW